MSAPRRVGRRRSGEAGQGLVELSVILPVFLLALFGLLDVGRLVYTNSVLSQAAREGARLGAIEAAWIGLSSDGCVADPSAIGASNPGAHVCPADVTAFKDHVVTAARRMTAAVGPFGALHLSCNAGDAGDPAPTGDWTESVGGNGCQDGSGNPVSGSGELVSVRLEYTYQPMTPVIGSILGSVPLSGSATMVIP